MEKEIGFKHYRWTVIGPKVLRGKRGHYLCQCDCGTVQYLRSDALLREEGKSCGCHRKDVQKARLTKHGHTTATTRSNTYDIWENLVSRCYNPNNQAFKDYGGKGITTSEEWRDFRNFLADMGERPKDLSIDRIDSNKGYSKENCKWSTRAQQNRNYATKSVYYDFMGFRFIQKDWATMLGFHLGAFRKLKVDKGLSIEAIADIAIAKGLWNGKIDFSYLERYNQYENYVPTDEDATTWQQRRGY